MTRRGRRRRDRVTVDELLREAGARPRGRRAPARASGHHGSGGRIALASAVAVILGGLVLALATRPDPVPGTTQFPPLAPATGSPAPTSAIAVPTRTTTPSPVVMQASRTPTPAPTSTVLIPPPVTTVPPSTMDPGSWYPGYASYGGGDHHGGHTR